MEYLAINASYVDKLNERVNEALKKGYKLQGGISSFNDNKYSSDYSQALYKEAPSGGKRKTRRNRKTLRNRK
jgi:hypothetical protein